MARIDFDLEKARNGAKLVTRGGYEARIVCYNKLGSLPLIVLVTIPDTHGYSEIIILMNDKGKVLDNYDASTDLFIEVPERWVVIYTNEFGRDTMHPTIFETKEAAEKLEKNLYTLTRVIKLIE